jgi:hypothetical protein
LVGVVLDVFVPQFVSDDKRQGSAVNF